MKFNKNGELKNTNTIVLTFARPTVPKNIKVAYMVVRVEVYIPNPMMCHKCQHFGHVAKFCRSKDYICANCGGRECGPDHKECKNSTCCPHCSEKHTSFSKDCKTWKLEKEVSQNQIHR